MQVRDQPLHSFNVFLRMGNCVSGWLILGCIALGYIYSPLFLPLSSTFCYSLSLPLLAAHTVGYAVCMICRAVYYRRHEFDALLVSQSVTSCIQVFGFWD